MIHPILRARQRLGVKLKEQDLDFFRTSIIRGTPNAIFLETRNLHLPPCDRSYLYVVRFFGRWIPVLVNSDSVVLTVYGRKTLLKHRRLIPDFEPKRGVS